MWWWLLACGSSAVPLHGADPAVVRDALVRNDLDGARAAARRVAETFPFGRRGQAVDEAAAAIAASPDVASASAAAGRMLVACAECHRGAPAGAPPAAPMAGDGLTVDMTRHRYAAEALWRGILRGDEAEISGAVTMLSAGSAVRAASDVDPSLPALGRVWDADVERIAARVRDDPAGRADAYGELLLTCAACHAAIRDQR